jgi:hypothetical protein
MRVTTMIPKLSYRVAIAQDTGPTGLRIMSVDDVPESRSDAVPEALQKWGREGWDLVAATPLPGGRVQYILKKPTDSAAE